jgi:hypothetical protein
MDPIHAIIKGTSPHDVINALLESDAEQRRLQREGQKGDTGAVSKWVANAIRSHGEPSAVFGKRYLRLGAASINTARTMGGAMHEPETAAAWLKYHEMNLQTQAQDPSSPYYHPTRIHTVSVPDDIKFAFFSKTSTPQHQANKLRYLRKGM